ncbi:hypothetical protein BT63DRAFT_420596 [Microthyrium microscopicum]|uniref:Uncharacterized protein n=1 Tax=Microthyrium microscopicum TaxID=703497 RepID=A0A6A6UV95_9PEZI|nr:hypothetical protein BT63DRAFT_420596 [Microthyrium microscopicum]
MLVGNKNVLYAKIEDRKTGTCSYIAGYKAWRAITIFSAIRQILNEKPGELSKFFVLKNPIDPI